MITCSFCQATHVDNTLFCNECGTYLLEEETRDTFELEEEENNKSEQPKSNGKKSPHKSLTDILSSPDEPIPPTLRLKIGSQNREIELTLDRIVYLGRVDPVANVYPEVDLTNDNAQEYGVSRQHVRLLPRDTGVFIEDQGTVNGSFLNGLKLTPYLAEALSDGDTLRLGRLEIEIKVQ